MCLHFFIVFNYNFSASNNSKVSYYYTYYGYPYFHQNWNLFAPVPKQNYELFVFNNGLVINVLGDVLQKHKKNRFSGNEGLLIAFTNSIHYFVSSTTVNSGLVINNNNFEMLGFSVKNYLKNKTEFRNAQPNILLKVTEINTKKIRYFYNKWGK